MVGPLKGGSHKKKYLLVMVDKFTKWIEAKPVKTSEAGPVIDFISGVVHLYDLRTVSSLTMALTSQLMR